jgi:hypothetical protein
MTPFGVYMVTKRFGISAACALADLLREGRSGSASAAPDAARSNVRREKRCFMAPP